MGLPTAERQWFRDTFADAFSRSLRLPEGAPVPTVAIVDFMMYVKFVAPNVQTKDQCLEYFVSKIRRILLSPTSTIKVCIVMVDGKKLPVKKMVTDPNRYKSNNTYPSDAKVWPRRGCDLIPAEWMRFAANSKLMRRELYPELFNRFMNFQLAPGQTLILSGFPGRSRYVDATSGAATSVHGWEQHTDTRHRVLQVQQWAAHELPISKAAERADPELYHRVYMVQHFVPCAAYPAGHVVHSEWVDAKNDISEADVRMFYFDHYFPNDHIIFHLNDGDVFSIGALYAGERLSHNRTQAGKYVFRNWHTVCMPYKIKKKKPKKDAEKKEGDDAFDDDVEQVGDEESVDDKFDEQGNIILTNHKRREEYVDMNALYCLIQAYEPFKRAKVDNHVATLVFLVIMAGSDFVPKLLHGMGAQNIIWDVFFRNAEALTHMVQLQQHLTPDGRSKRTIVLDEDAFILFIYWCYLRKYDTALKNQTATFAQLQSITREKSDVRFHMPKKNTLRLWSRAVLWNLLYWKNGPAGHVPDCFETWFGVPYFPYWRNPQTHKMQRVDMVAWRPKPVDAVFAQNMKNPEREDVEPRPKRAKQAELSKHIQVVLDIFDRSVSK